MADASTISGSSSIATKPDPLFCDDADVFAAVLAALPVFTDVVADVDADAIVVDVMGDKLDAGLLASTTEARGLGRSSEGESTTPL